MLSQQVSTYPTFYSDNVARNQTLHTIRDAVQPAHTSLKLYYITLYYTQLQDAKPQTKGADSHQIRGTKTAQRPRCLSLPSPQCTRRCKASAMGIREVTYAFIRLPASEAWPSIKSSAKMITSRSSSTAC